jgi:hypothetical protein
MRYLTLFILFWGLIYAQNTMTPIERFEYEPGIIFPEGTQKLEGPTCEEALVRFAQQFGTSLNVQGFGCYAKLEIVSADDHLSSFGLTMTRAGYQLAQEEKFESSDNGYQQRVIQAYVREGASVISIHVYDPDAVLSYLALIIDESELTVSAHTQATAIAFDPSIALPEGTSQIEGSSCERSAENVKYFIESMNRPTDHLVKYRCYGIYTNNWRSTAHSIMALFENANYKPKNLTAEDLSIIYQVWSKDSSQHPLHVYFAEDRTGSGLFFVILRD